MRVLVVEDEERLARVVRRVLEQEGYQTDVAADGAAAVALAQSEPFDVIVLDVMLPVMAGTQVVRVLRESGNQTPVLMLTALGEVHDRVRGLDMGADDYLTKPFSFDELLARIRALVRRGGQAREDLTLRVGDLEMDLARHVVRLRGRHLDLTPTEFRLLELLMRHPGQVFSRARILERVWGYAFEGTANVVDTYVHYLRAKLGQDKGVPRIRTVRGVGYALREG